MRTRGRYLSGANRVEHDHEGSGTTGVKRRKITCFNTPDPPRKKRTCVVNARTDEFDVYIGRAVIGARNSCMTGNSPYLCPFQAPGEPLTPEQLECFHAAMVKRLTAPAPKWRTWLRRIQGLRLGCWCKPAICHGDLLAEFADKLPSEEELRAGGMSAKGLGRSIAALVRERLGIRKTPAVNGETPAAMHMKAPGAATRRKSTPLPQYTPPKKNLYGGGAPTL